LNWPMRFYARLQLFLLTFKDIDRVPVKQVSLIQTRSNTKTRVPASLELALTGIEEKYGDSALVWGIKDKHKQSSAFKPEILRREKMLAFWDPVRIDKTQVPAS
jgi:hypothetical protein